MFDAVASTGAGLVLMHMRGEPKTMQEDPTYDDVVAEVHAFSRPDRGGRRGGDRARPPVRGPRDRVRQDHRPQPRRVARIGTFHDLGVPILVGASRKRFLELSGTEDPGDDSRVARRGGVVRDAGCRDRARARRRPDRPGAARRRGDRSGPAVTDEAPLCRSTTRATVPIAGGTTSRCCPRGSASSSHSCRPRRRPAARGRAIRPRRRARRRDRPRAGGAVAQRLAADGSVDALVLLERRGPRT